MKPVDIHSLQDIFNPLAEEVNYSMALKHFHTLEEKVMHVLLRWQNLITGLSSEHKAQLENYFRRVISAKKRIILTYPFAACANKKSYSFPYANWSEAFALSFLLKQCLQITKLYPIGVTVNIQLQDFLVDRVNNVPLKFIEEYMASFKAIAALFQPYRSGALTLNVTQYSDILDTQLFQKDVEEDYKLVDTSQFSVDLLDRVKRNIYTYKSDQDIIISAAYNAAYFKNTNKHLYNKTAQDEIIIVGRSIFSPDSILLPLRSYHNSRVQFWVGDGVIVLKKNGKQYNTILSPQQEGKFKLHGFVDTFLKLPYLKTIPIYEEI